MGRKRRYDQKMNKYHGGKWRLGEPPNFSGQHLMHNKRLLNEIVDRAKISQKDTVLELGAGKGALTRCVKYSLLYYNTHYENAFK